MMMKKIIIAQTLSLLFSGLTFSTAQAAKVDGELTVGFINFDLDQASNQFGQYIGVSDDAYRLLADFDLSHHSSKHYLYLNGNDLGFDSRKLGINWGQYGRYNLSFEHSELNTLLSTNALTPYEGIGTDNITLPTGFVDGAVTSEMSTLAQNLKRTDLVIDRTRNRLKISVTPKELWSLSLLIHREEQKGTKPLGAPIGNTGRWGYPSTILPAPINQTTDHIQAALGYSDSFAQWEVNYHVSRFNNNYTALTWDNPFSTDTNPGTPINYPERGLISLAPDNSYQNLGLNGALNLATTTRIVMTANFSRMEQDSKLLDYTTNPASTITVPLSRDSTNARIDTSRLRLKLTSKPLPRLSINAAYNYDKSNNRTPSSLFLRVTNDNGGQTAINESRASYNHPFDMSRNRIKLDGSYYFGRGISLKLAHQEEHVERSNRAVEKTRERSQSAKLNSRFSRMASANLSLRRDHRRADSGYNNDRAYQVHHTSDYIATVSANEQFDNNPKLRQYDIADRDRDNIAFNFNVYPNSDTVLGIYYNNNQEEYPDSTLGLGSNDQENLTLDVSYSPQQNFSLFSYYTQERGDFELRGTEFNAAGPPGTKFNTANNPDDFWQVNNNDIINTIGFGGRFAMLRDDLQLKVKVYQSSEKNRIAFITGTNLTPIDLPQDKSVRHGMELEGEYAMKHNLDIGLGLAYEKYQISQWARDGIAPGSSDVDELITLLAPNSNYTAYVVYTMLRFKW